MLTIDTLILILVANGSPIFISYLFSHRASLPVDMAYKLADQQYLFGATKTWRGLISALIITPVSALFLGYSFYFGLLIAVFAMAGDLFSSFIKRRLKKTSSARFLFLDQIPEALFPALICYFVYGLGLIQVIEIVLAFIIIELTSSFVLFRYGIRKKPY